MTRGHSGERVGKYECILADVATGFNTFCKPFLAFVTQKTPKNHWITIIGHDEVEIGSHGGGPGERALIGL